MEKIINCYSLQQAQKDALFYKLKLEDIMSTLQEEKLYYDTVQIQKIKQYQQQIESKNHLIDLLTTDLSDMQKQLQEKNKLNQSYKAIIQHLKKEFFKMFQAVRKVSEQQNSDQRQVPTLKRVKSDLHQTKSTNIQTKKRQSHFCSPLKKMRIDINSYFINLKQELKFNLTQRNSYGQKDSSKTKYTDQQLRSSASQQFKETTCFKDLIANQINSFSNTYDFKSLKNFDSQTCLRSTWARKYKENNWLSSR